MVWGPSPLRARRALAIDLGTANTVVFRRGDGVVIFEPSVVAIDDLTGEVRAVGEDARRMIGRTPAHIRATRPLRHGVITDYETTEQMLRHFIRRGMGGRGGRPDVVICVPGGVTGVERSAVEEATLAVGAGRVFLIDEPMAAAVGAGLPVAEPIGSLVVDVGGGTSEIGVVALGALVVSHSIRVGGYDFDDAIVRLLQTSQRLLVGQEQAEQVKIEIGSAPAEAHDDTTTTVAGRDLTTGLLRRTTVTTTEVARALAPLLTRIADEVRNVLEETPPELAADLSRTGLTLVGGGALLPGFADFLRRQTGLTVTVDDDPLTTVARGAGASLTELALLQGRRRYRRR
ncbi:MAG TPA: rod shape-determining protein [Gaiellaceae bacterium]|nr:rod shape-determining protein [Gaiellaceae bacterium]